MTTTLPRFRRDLVVTPQRGSAGPAYVIKDPATGSFYRLSAPEHFVAQQLDGATPPETIRKRIHEKFGDSPSPNALAKFLEQLGRLGLIEGEGNRAAGRGHVARGRLARGSLLYLRFPAFDPDWILTRLVRGLGLLFTPWFVTASTIAILAGVAVTLSNWDAILGDLGRLYSVEGILVVYLTAIGIGIVHEFAHGLTCKRFGGEVREMGFMLLYFQPALYCNVSDAWLFPAKSKRLWVTLAGPHFELFLWGLATLTWRVTVPETPLNLAALVVLTTSGVRTLFNFIPLIKLDGYYLLSDYLEIPNLRKRSFEYLWGLVRGRVPKTTRRERRIFLLYGVLAGAFTVCLLGWLGTRLGGFLVSQLAGPGFVLFLVLFSAILASRFPRLFRPLRAVRSLFAGVARRLWRFAAIAAAVAGLVMLARVPLPLNVSGQFTVLPIRNADVRAEVEGLVAEVLVAEGDTVVEGTPIARLSDRQYRAELGKAEASIDERRARLKMLLAGPTPEQVEVARRELATARALSEQTRLRHAEAQEMLGERRKVAAATVERVEVRLGYAESNLERAREMRTSGLISEGAFETADERVAVSRRELEEARGALRLVLADTLADARRDVMAAEMAVAQAEANLQMLLAGSRAEEIEATRAEVALIETERRHIEASIGLLTVTSPISGVVTTPTRQLAEMVGKLVKPGDLIAAVHELGTVTVEIAVPEKEFAAVEIGQPVTLRARAYPHRTFHAEVTAIATTLHNEPEPGVPGLEARDAPRTVRVTTVVENGGRLLKPEMTGMAKIAAGERSLSDSLGHRLAGFLKLEFWSWW